MPIAPPHNKIRHFIKQLIRIPLLLLLALIIRHDHESSTFDIIQQRGYIKVISVVGPISYYENAKGPTGFDYLLSKAFADYLSVDLKVNLVSNLNSILISLGGPNGDFAAAGLNVTEQRKAILRFSEPYNNDTSLLIYRLGTKRPRNFSHITDDSRLLVIANSSHLDLLQKQQKKYPNLQWEEYKNADMLELMEQIHNDAANYAVVDSLAYLVNRGIYPKARIGFEIGEPQPIAWAFPNYGDDSLIRAANQFLSEPTTQELIAKLKEQFFGHVDEFSVAGSQLFIKRINDRLPQYEELFKEVGEQFNVDWHLIAAIAYQESHWNPLAKSPTGVRGLMMLTQDTAKEMNVRNRLDAEQSCYGGTQYFLKTRAKIPDDIHEPDTTWMALAAYNIGFGHLNDARILAERDQKDSHIWENIRLYLPLLEQKKYYSTLKHGFARGREAASYVQNIKHYKDILQWRSLEQEREQERKRIEKIEIWQPPATLSSVFLSPAFLEKITNYYSAFNR
jgi:membrane-bound lytic murein transglycosylase F